MNIIIKDDQGLDSALMMQGYTREQRLDAKQTIRTAFRDTCIRVFQDILGKPLPETLTVNMVISDNDELKGERAARLASYNVVMSRRNSCVFSILEITVRAILDKKDRGQFDSTVIHEMFHAADKPMLDNNHKLFDEIRNEIYKSRDDFDRNKRNAPIALLHTLQVFGHYRAEGVAILGESLLTKKKFRSTDDVIRHFCIMFQKAMVRSQMRMDGHNMYEDATDKEVSHSAYGIAPTILLLALEQQGALSNELAQKALKGLDSGEYQLADDEIITIMRSALSLSLTGYIQGLMGLGDKVAPIRPFLDFCASYQQEWDIDNIAAFEQLSAQPKSVEAFNMAMDQIMGCFMPVEELAGFYEEFMNSEIDETQYPKMKEKVSTLFTIMKSDENTNRQQTAQWALTYLFDDQDLIHDDVSGLGLVDDLMVIDYALSLL